VWVVLELEIATIIGTLGEPEKNSPGQKPTKIKHGGQKQ
jgi:hypothetical protein